MKKIGMKFLCSFCAAVIFMSTISFGLIPFVKADEPVGKMSSVYGYILNDYIMKYGVMSTDKNGAIFDSTGNTITPSGVVYGDILNFDNNNCPYLVIFVADSEYKSAECHLWLYNDETQKARKVAVIEKSYSDIPKDMIGEFNIAWKNEKRYITFNTYQNNVEQQKEVYTVINGEAYMYINNPADITEVGIMDYNAYYFHPGIDVSDYNKQLDVFFTKLKDTAAKSVTYENIATKLSAEDKTQINRVLIKSALYCDFDIKNYTSLDEYNEGLTITTSSDKFTQLSAIYSLGDDIYYAKFDTNRTKYNYALLRKTDALDDGYQILKVRTDCIPLADIELKQARYEYSQNPLIMAKSKTTMELNEDKTAVTPTSTNVTVKVGDNEPITVTKAPEPTPDIKETDKKISIKKILDDKVKLPIACTGGGIAIALLTFLWVYMYEDE